MRFAFLSGLPRTGSTVLGKMLSQHEKLHVTPTSPINRLIAAPFNFCLGTSHYFDINDESSPAWAISRSILTAAYEHIPPHKTVLEKDRGWSRRVQMLEGMFRETPKIIAPVRKIPDILSSFVLLCQRIGPNNQIDAEIRNRGLEVNNENRCDIIWDKYVMESWRDLKTGVEYNPRAFILLTYDSIVEAPQQTVEACCNFLGLDSFQVKTTGLSEQKKSEDLLFGLPGLHTLRDEIRKNSPPAKEVLGDRLFSLWASRELEFWDRG